MQQRGTGLGQRDTGGSQQLTCLGQAEAQFGRAEFGQLTGQPQLMQPQWQITPRRDYRVGVRRKAGQQAGELGERFRRPQLVQIIDDQEHALVLPGQFGEHPVHHGPPVQAGGAGRRFRAACAGGPADLAEQREPELLRVLLIALHLQHRDPVRRSEMRCPGAQQRRLAAPGRRRDDRYLPRGRAVKGSEQPGPADQPGGRAGHGASLNPHALPATDPVLPPWSADTWPAYVLRIIRTR